MKLQYYANPFTWIRKSYYLYLKLFTNTEMIKFDDIVFTEVECIGEDLPMIAVRHNDKLYITEYSISVKAAIYLAKGEFAREYHRLTGAVVTY